MASHIEQTYQERILKVLVHIQNHLDDELSLEDLASAAYFSPFHFHRIFTAYTGESIKSYVRRLRLERATRDLIYTDLSIIQISERAGYDTQQSFHRAFKETFNKTPKSFRDKSIEVITQLFPINKTSDKTYDVEVKIIEPIKVAFVRHIGSYDYKDAFQAWIQLIAEIGLTHVLSNKTKKISIAHDSPDTTRAENLRYDACMTIDELTDFKPKGSIGLQTLAGGNMR
jgi:AraC family transcriptional regulator